LDNEAAVLAFQSFDGLCEKQQLELDSFHRLLHTHCGKHQDVAVEDGGDFVADMWLRHLEGIHSHH
jgi:hypothetical protein